MATYILADRLALLEAQGLLTKAVAADKKLKFTYRLTEKDVAAVPVLVKLILWGTGHCSTIIDAGWRAELPDNKAAVVAKYQWLAREQASA